MATYQHRKNSHNVVYQYQTSSGEVKQKWESYTTELETVQRKALIDYLQTNKKYDKIHKLATEYTKTIKTPCFHSFWIR